MPSFTARSPMPASAEQLFAYHERAGALERLLPPWQSVRVEKRGGIRDGERVVLRLGPGPLALRWVAEHRGYRAGREFQDVQLAGPFARWVHTHRCIPAGSASELEDAVEYELPAGALGRTLGARSTRQLLERMFRFRHERTRRDLERQLPESAPLRVAITGATGLVGTSLAAFLTTAGHRVLRVTRRPTQSDDVGWDPRRGELDAAALEGVDAVVHLAGESVFGLRWSEAKKRAIRDSRVAGTRLVAETLARLARPPRVLVSASAIGYYGDRGRDTLTETSEPGDGFLADVCRDWEAASVAAEKAGIRVARLRIGVVLSGRGGALATMLPAFRLGLGGRLGDGRQRMSWIALDDLVGAIHFVLRHDELAGAVNASAPEPVTNGVFTRTLGRVLGRPTVLPVPAPLLRAALGQMGEEMLLASAAVEPARLAAAGFEFVHPELEGALRMELGRLRGPGPAMEHAP